MAALVPHCKTKNQGETGGTDHQLLKNMNVGEAYGVKQ